MGVSYEFVRGDSDGINGKQLKDGQLLFDTEKRRISIDTTINGSLSRVNMSSSADNFVGTTAEWNALTSTEKAQYKTVDITDDYEGAIAIDSALSSTSTNPVQNKVITGELSKTYSESDATESNIADDDYIPFYDISSSAKKKSPLSNIISKIQAASISVQDVLTSTDSTKPLSANMGNALGKMIAPIESSSIASRAYVIGEQFIYNGITYKATSAISLGDTITPNGNCISSDSVTSQIQILSNYNAEKFYDNAGAHNSIYRGKNLGNSVTAEQYAAISAGTFEDLYIGDYWEMNTSLYPMPSIYRIAHFNYWLNTGKGETEDQWCVTNHVLIVPDYYLSAGPMNKSAITTGGYAGSDFKTGNNSNTVLQSAKDEITTAFGSNHILTHYELFTNSFSIGSTGWISSSESWYVSDIDLMSEIMVYGTNISSCHNYEAGGLTIDKTQLKLFSVRPDLIRSFANCWLRDVASSTSFASINSCGYAVKRIASDPAYIRPVFAIKA